MYSVLGRLAVEELAGLGVEVVELLLENRDDVPGHVLVDLGVLDRADAALAALLLADVLLEPVLVLGGCAYRFHKAEILHKS